MQIYIQRNGQSFGPYSIDEIDGYLDTGELTDSDLAQWEGTAKWFPLSQLAFNQPPDTAAPPIQVPPRQQIYVPPGRKTDPASTQQPYAPPQARLLDPRQDYSSSELRKIASYQRIVLWLVVVCLAAAMTNLVPIVVVTGICSLIFIYQLARALRSPVAILYAVISALPFIGLIVLLIISSKATNVLRRAGVNVGFLGASERDLAELARQRQ